jgi:hypothetical protein
MKITELLGGELPQGAFFMCLAEFPQFKADFEALVDHGIVNVTGRETCEWTGSQTSLAEYFKWIGAPHSVTGGFWGPVSKCFGIGKRALSKGASGNGNPLKPEYTRDFIKIKKVLEQYRAKVLTMQKELRLFRRIKKLVIAAKNEEPEMIHEVLPKISALFTSKNVDKKPLVRR